MGPLAARVRKLEGAGVASPHPRPRVRDCCALLTAEATARDDRETLAILRAPGPPDPAHDFSGLDDAALVARVMTMMFVDRWAEGPSRATP